MSSRSSQNRGDQRRVIWLLPIYLVSLKADFLFRDIQHPHKWEIIPLGELLCTPVNVTSLPVMFCTVSVRQVPSIYPPKTHADMANINIPLPSPRAPFPIHICCWSWLLSQGSPVPLSDGLYKSFLTLYFIMKNLSVVMIPRPIVPSTSP